MARKPDGGWSAPLARPLVLRDGTRLETLADARRSMLELPDGDQERNAWLKAAEQLTAAAEQGGDVAAATEQVAFALSVQGKLALK